MIPISVAALMVRDNRVFLGKRRDGSMRGFWELPGGKCELGETPEEALRRELREELDLEVEVDRRCVSVRFFHRGKERELQVFRVHETNQAWTPPVELPEHTETGWFSTRELANMKATLVDSDREALSRLPGMLLKD